MTLRRIPANVLPKTRDTSRREISYYVPRQLSARFKRLPAYLKEFFADLTPASLQHLPVYSGGRIVGRVVRAESCSFRFVDHLCVVRFHALGWLENPPPLDFVFDDPGIVSPHSLTFPAIERFEVRQ